jgi:hypothetical protein
MPIGEVCTSTVAVPMTGSGEGVGWQPGLPSRFPGLPARNPTATSPLVVSQRRPSFLFGKAPEYMASAPTSKNRLCPS